MKASFILKIKKDYEYGQRTAAHALKRFLTDQFIKFFLLIGPSNALSICSETLTTVYEYGCKSTDNRVNEAKPEIET